MDDHGWSAPCLDDHIEDLAQLSMFDVGAPKIEAATDWYPVEVSCPRRREPRPERVHRARA